MSKNSGKTFFAKHAKSSAALISLIVHAILLIIATTYVMVTVIPKNEAEFEAKKIKRPKMELKKLKVPVKVERRKKPAAKLKTTFVTKTTRKVPEFVMPEVSGVKGGIGAMDLSEGSMEIGFTLPEIDFFGAKAKGEKIVFVVHFGPATTGGDGAKSTPFTRMTAYTIRKRLQEMITNLPEYALFNVTAYWARDCNPFAEKMLPATSANKQLLMDWMAPVNPVENEHRTYGASWEKEFRTRLDKTSWPQRLDSSLPPYAPKWMYVYWTPPDIKAKYLQAVSTDKEDKEAKGDGFVHWNRGVAWALTTQKPDTIFILTTNYIDPYGNQANGNPSKMSAIFRQMCRDIYGPDPKKYPTINVVVLASAGTDGSRAGETLSLFRPIVDAFKGEKEIIEDITDYMTPEEKARLQSYRE